MSHLHRGRLIRLRHAKTEAQRDAVRHYVAKEAPAVHVGIGAPAPAAAAVKPARKKAKAKKRAKG